MCRASAVCVNVLPCVLCPVIISLTIQIPQPNKQVRSTDRHIVRSIALRFEAPVGVFHVSVGLRSFCCNRRLVRWNQSGLAATHVSQH